MKLCFPGTQLEKEFADFLKADSRRAAIITGINCQSIQSSSPRI
jgi:hypothetical protein